MNWADFFQCYMLFLLGVVAQVPFMIMDKRFTRAQVARSSRKLDYAALEHGGFLMDPLLCGVLAYLASNYAFDFHSTSARLVIMGVIGVTAAFVVLWEAAGDTVGDCYVHGGETEVAGVIHAMFFALALVMIAEVYLGLTTPVVTERDLLFVSGFLTIFLPIGVMKFSPRWHWDRGAVIQVACCEILLWGVTVWRLW